MDLKKELRIMVEYILPPEDRDKDVIENYVDTLALINKEYVKQLSIPRVVSSFVYVLKAKDREEPLGIYKTYQKAYRSKTNFAKMNWTNTCIEKWKIS